MPGKVIYIGGPLIVTAIATVCLPSMFPCWAELSLVCASIDYRVRYRPSTSAMRYLIVHSTTYLYLHVGMYLLYLGNVPEGLESMLSPRAAYGARSSLRCPICISILHECCRYVPFHGSLPAPLANDLYEPGTEQTVSSAHLLGFTLGQTLVATL